MILSQGGCENLTSNTTQNKVALSEAQNICYKQTPFLDIFLIAQFSKFSPTIEAVSYVRK